MTTITLFREEHYICESPEEARTVWRDKDKRPRIWMESEAAKCFLMDTDKLLEIVQRKRDKPGYTYKEVANG